MSLTIAGVPVDAWLDKGTLSHENALGSEPDTLRFDLVPVGANGVPCPELVGGSDVYLTDALGALLFGGVLQTPTDTPLKLNAGYSCTAVDWRARLDQRTLNARRRNMTAGAMLVYLVKRYAPGFDTSLVDLGGAVLGSVRFKPPERLTQALDRLSALTGYVWDVTPDKKLLWAPAGTVPAPYPLTNTSSNFENLCLTVDRSELKNRVIVLGARYPVPLALTESFAGDALQRHWPLSYKPYVQDDYIELDESFGSFDVAPGGRWVQTDVTNPSPPAGHAASEGYLFTTTMSGGALSESGWLQIVGGSGTWGQVALMSAAVFARGDGAKRFELDVYAENTIGQGRFGLWDPNNQGALAGEAFGLFFDAGTLRASQGGVTAGSTLTYTGGALTSYTRIRITPKVTAGGIIQAQTGANYGTRNWVTLLDTNTGTLANLTFAAAFNKNFNGRADRARVYNRLYGLTVTVGGVAKTVGVLNADESSGVDCVIGGGLSDENPLLSFFSDVIPPVGSPAGSKNITITYHRTLQVKGAAQDSASITASAALEGGDGVHETWIEDQTVDTPELARTRAAQEVALYGQAARSIAWSTTVPGLRAGQGIEANVTVRQRPVVGGFLITRVVASSLGAPGRYSYEVEASSRMKGAGDLLLELLGRGRKLDAGSLDDGSLIEEWVFGTDTVSWGDTASVQPGPLPPFRWDPAAITLDSTADWTAGTHTRTVALAGTLTIAAATFTRASTATMPDTGATVASGVPRFPAVAGTGGLMVEGVSSNFMLYSDFTTATDQVSGTSSVVKTTHTINGVARAGIAWVQGPTSELVSVGLHVGAITLDATRRLTISVWLRRSVSATAKSVVRITVSGTNYDLNATGNAWVTPTVEGTYPWAGLFAGATPGAWSRQSWTFPAIPAGTLTSFSLGGPYRNNGGFTVDLADLQLEPGTVVTTLIPASGAIATRAAESATIPAYPFADASQGTVLVRAYFAGDHLLASPSRNYSLLFFDNGSFSEQIQIFRATGSSCILFRIGSVAGGQIDTTWPNPTIAEGWHNVAASWSPTARYLHFDGSQVAGGTATIPAPNTSTFTRRYLCSSVGSGHWNQPVAFVAFYPTMLTTAEIVTEQANGCANAGYRHDFRNATLLPETTATHLTGWLDSGIEGAGDFGQAWDAPAITQTTPANTTATRRFRCQNTLGGSGLTAWAASQGEYGPRGRYVQVETSLTTGPGSTTAPSVDVMTMQPTAARAGLCTAGPWPEGAP